MAYEMSEDEDDVRAALENWFHSAQEIVRDFDWPDPAEEPAERDTRFADAAIEQEWRALNAASKQRRKVHAERASTEINALLSAATQRELWSAIRLALRVGLAEGHQQAYPFEYHATVKLLDRAQQLLEAQRETSRREAELQARLLAAEQLKNQQLEARIRGGRSRRGGHKKSDEEIRAAFEKVKMAHPDWKPNAWYTTVAKDLGLDRGTVWRRLKG